MRGARRGPDDARPVTEDAVQWAIGFGRIASDAVRRGVVRHDGRRADGVVTVVLMRRGGPHAECGQRDERDRGNRACTGAEPLKHQTTRLTLDTRGVKDTRHAVCSRRPVVITARCRLRAARCWLVSWRECAQPGNHGPNAPDRDASRAPALPAAKDPFLVGNDRPCCVRLHVRWRLIRRCADGTTDRPHTASSPRPADHPYLGDRSRAATACRRGG